MSDTYQIVFLKAGDGSPGSQQSVAQKIATATRSSPEALLKHIERAPFIYKKGLPKAKAENIAAALDKLGAVTEVRPESPAVATVPGKAAPPPRPPQAPPPPRPAPAASAPSSFSFDAPPSAPTPASSGGFDFGAPAASASGSTPSYDFDAPAPSASGTPAAADFGGFGFGAPSPAGKSDDFPIEEPSGSFAPFSAAPAPAGAAPAPPPSSPPAAGGFAPFNFSPEAATAAPAKKSAVSEVAVSRNFDYAADAPKEAPAPPARAAKGKASGPEMTQCPRCQAEVPVANECASCGVVLAKAGEGAAAAAPRRRGRAPARTKKSPLLYVAVAVIAAVALFAAAFFGGLLNPMRLKSDAGKSALLRQYGVKVAPPEGPIARGVLADPAKAEPLQQGFFDRSRAIEQELKRLGSLASLAEFDQGHRALEAEVGEYTRHPGNLLFGEVLKVVSPYYRVQGAGLTIGGATYVFPEVITLTGVATDPSIVSIVSDAQFREQIKTARLQVAQAEVQRLARERAQSSDVSFVDNFSSGLGDRWQQGRGSAVNASGGRLRIIGQQVAATAAPRLVTAEPDADYVAKVTASGGGSDTRGGILIVSPRGFLALVKVRRGGSDMVQFLSDQGEGGSAQAGRDVQLRVERKAGQYSFSFWNGARNSWTEVDRAQPGWVAEGGRLLGLTAFGGTSTFEFDDFNLTVTE